MQVRQKAAEELKAMAVLVVYFGLWVAVLMVTKRLVLADYHIRFRGFSLAVFGVLVIAKVVLVLEHVRLGGWVERKPAALNVVLRTTLYALGIALAMLLEKAFEMRGQYGGFTNALPGVLHNRDSHHVWVNTIWLACSLLVFNALAVIRRRFGDRELLHTFFRPETPDRPDRPESFISTRPKGAESA